jgi:hypothetical protein
MTSLFQSFRQSLIVQRLAARAALPIAARVSTRFNFDSPQEMAAYQSAKSWCEAQFGALFIWQADVGKGTATFGFTRFADALLFALHMPEASIHE